MLIKLVKAIPRFSFCLPAQAKTNPFQSLTSKQLLDYLAKNPYPQSTNTLIYLGSVMNKYQMKEVSFVLKSLEKMIKKQIDTNNQNPDSVNYGDLIKLYIQNSHYTLSMESSKSNIQEVPKFIIESYINCHIHTTQDIIQHIYCYEKLSKIMHPTSESQLATDLCYSKIQHYFKNMNYSLSELIQYYRIFRQKLSDPHFYQLMKKRNEIPGLSRIDKLYLQYILIHNFGLNRDDLKQIGFGLHNCIQLQKNDDAKFVCMKLEIMKKLDNQHQIGYSIKNNTNLKGWTYQYLIWISDFMEYDDSLTLLSNIQTNLINTRLFPYDNLQTITFYISNLMKLDHASQQKFLDQIGKWLSEQNLSYQKSQNVCRIFPAIDYIAIRKYKFFNQFHKKATSQALGNYRWQQKCILYYYGMVWQTQDQNLEYLRRYILNDYVALGTARRDIPTSSYFYKILEVTNVQNFYANYINR